MSTNGPQVKPNDAELRNYIQVNEGLAKYSQQDKRYHVYRDQYQNLTVGIGSNVSGQPGREKLAAIGADYDDVVVRDRGLTKDQVYQLLHIDLLTAINDAKQQVKNFDLLDHAQQVAIVDLEFNLGSSSFGGFNRFIKAMNNGDWITAKDELLDSKLPSQIQQSRLDGNLDLIQRAPMAFAGPLYGEGVQGTRTTSDTWLGEFVAERVTASFDLIQASPFSVSGYLRADRIEDYATMLTPVAGARTLDYIKTLNLHLSGAPDQITGFQSIYDEGQLSFDGAIEGGMLTGTLADDFGARPEIDATGKIICTISLRVTLSRN